MMNVERILFVDDDQNLLDGMQNQFRKLFRIECALGGEEGLRKMAEPEPFAVVVSDMRMPGMDGIQFLSRVAERCPDTVRIMLTGNADLGTAMAAVNEGRIFRFVTKPCPQEVMRNVLEAAIHQYRLITSEKELLEKTLKGSIKVLVDILSITNPAAFSRAMRVKEYVAQLTLILQLADGWEFEVAAMLSQIGYVTIPSETLERAIAGAPLSESERKMVVGSSEFARNLLQNIPRLEMVAQMIARQGERFDAFPASLAGSPENPAHFGSQILKTVVDFDSLVAEGMRPQSAIQALENKKGEYNPKILAAMKAVKTPTFEKTLSSVKLDALRKGMVLADDIRAKDGLLIVSKGQEVNEVMKRRLDNYYLQGRIKDLVLVYCYSMEARKPSGADND
jgi:response regulator RpfG family c-di-GMP phosphodiesterase